MYRDCCVLVLGVLGTVAAVEAQVTYTDDYKLYLERVGFNKLKTELGVNMPTGNGVGVSQVEAWSGSGYAPGTIDTVAGTSVYQNHTLVLKSGSTGKSTHAESVARFLFGDLSMSKGVTTLHSYDATGWLYWDHVNEGSYSQPPLVETNRVSSHSYIYSGTTADQIMLRKTDYAIDRDDYTAVFATQSGNTTVLPGFGASYNGIVVGRSDLDGSYITGTVSGGEGNGRSKPDIVAPERMTSYTTPIVAGAATLLWETANKNAALAQARHSESIKAVMLAGATKEEFMQPTTPAANFWTRTPTKPLSQTWGAGQVNIYNSYHILTAGQHAAASTVTEDGWDFSQTTASPKTYYFDIAQGTALEKLSIILTWNRLITVVDNNWAAPQSFLANLDLKLYQMNGAALGSLVDQSISTIDNVEHIYLPGDLAAGRYAMQITSDTLNTDYSIAWRSDPITVPEPTMLAPLAIGFGMLVRRRTKRADA